MHGIAELAVRKVETSKRQDVETLRLRDGGSERRLSGSFRCLFMPVRHARFGVVWMPTLWIVVMLLPGAAARSYAQPFDAPQSPAQPDAVSDDEFRLPVSDSLAARIDALIARLGSRAYKQREDATLALIEIGSPAFAALRTTYHACDALEVRFRIERIIHTGYFNYHLYNRNGFLGIEQLRIPKLSDDDPRIREGHFGIEVRRVIEETAAEEAGLRESDIIVALNGEELEGGGVRATTIFGESVRVLGPGATIRLTILRGPEELEIDATLRPRPRRFYLRQGSVTEMFDQTRRRFRVWWAAHFRQVPSDEPAPGRNEPR